MALADSGALDLPPEFVRWNSADQTFLRALPGYLDELAARWSLLIEPHFPGIRFNYVAPATCADGTRAVLKVSRHVDETRNEIAALRLWDGDGACRLLEADPEIGALLTERLDPGTMLVEVSEREDDAATLIAAQMLRRLWRPASEEDGLRPLASWCAGFDRNREALTRGARGFPAAIFLRADALRQALLDSTPEQSVLHGDLHHFNVLRAQREPWLAIDPKGLLGDRCFDVCQFLRNPWPGPSDPVATNRRRLDIFCAELGLDRARVKDWCFVHAVLD
ncbi:MAG TPA: aminoglycoside phosphotransferase family protein, partial [Dehalococcoidia bacterium]|nr:aminoglycoside phosphotransferase family protein [Dehalococcoidia bacterium]